MSARKEQMRREALAQKRFRGHRIKQGLSDLGDLDAPAAQKVKTDEAEQNNKAPVVGPSSTAVEDISHSPHDDEPTTDEDHDLGGSSSRSVFGRGWKLWRHVKSTLFDPTASPADKKKALQEIRMWYARVRKHRAMPPYVESTELLMEAVLNDELCAIPSHALVHQYGGAISRSVHVMTGSFATGEANTYRKRAREIGFPEEAVEVRQRVAHGALPSISELRWVCGLVLQYLFVEYWVVQEKHLKLMEAEAKSAASEKASRSVLKEPPSTSVDEMKALLAALDGTEETVDKDEDEESSPLLVIGGWSLQ